MDKQSLPRALTLFADRSEGFRRRQAILEGRYDVPSKMPGHLGLKSERCESLKIMGSAFFLLDDHTRARKLWSKFWKSIQR